MTGYKISLPNFSLPCYSRKYLKRGKEGGRRERGGKKEINEKEEKKKFPFFSFALRTSPLISMDTAEVEVVSKVPETGS